MNGWEQFCNGFKDFINQPLTEIITTILVVGVMVLFIIGKTSFGKKALFILKDKITKGTEELHNAKDELDNYKKVFEEYKQNKEQEIKDLTNTYETKLSAYKGEFDKLNGIIKVLCENSVNKNVKQAFKEYLENQIDVSKLHTSEIIEQAKEQVKSDYNSKYKELENEIKELKELVGGKDEKDKENE